MRSFSALLLVACFATIQSVSSLGNLLQHRASAVSESDQETCENGFFLNQYDECEVCARCTPGYFEVTACSTSANTECASCLSDASLNHENFATQCTHELKSHRAFMDMMTMHSEVTSMHEELKETVKNDSNGRSIEYVCYVVLFIFSVFAIAKMVVMVLSRGNNKIFVVSPTVNSNVGHFIVHPATLLKQTLTGKKYERLEEDV